MLTSMSLYKANTKFSASLAACIRLNYTINLTDQTDYLCKFLVNPSCDHIVNNRNSLL